MRGKMIWFNEKKDHGFIRTDEDERLKVLGIGFADGARPVGRCADAVVTFDISEGSGTRRATNVRFEPETAARRARLRSGGLRVRS
jgi:cold shock CspA family protein